MYSGRKQFRLDKTLRSDKKLPEERYLFSAKTGNTACNQPTDKREKWKSESDYQRRSDPGAERTGRQTGTDGSFLYWDNNGGRISSRWKNRRAAGNSKCIKYTDRIWRRCDHESKLFAGARYRRTFHMYPGAFKKIDRYTL